MRILGAIILLCGALSGCVQQSVSTPIETPMDPAIATLPIRWWEGLGDPVIDTLVARALDANLDLALSLARVRELRAIGRQTASVRYPGLSLTGSHERSRSGSEGHEEDYFYGLDLSWEIDLFGRLDALSRAAEAQTEAAQADYEALRVSLIVDVVGTYLNFRLASEEALIAARAADTQAETARITRIRFEQGTASGFDVERFDSQVAVTRAAVPEARRQAAGYRYALAYLLDLDATSLDAILARQSGQGPMDAQPTMDALLAMPASSLTYRPDARAAAWRLQAAGANLDAARALRFPQVTLGALLGVEQGFSSAAWSVTGGLVQPLVDFGAIRGSIDASQAQQQQAAYAYQLVLNGAVRDLRTALTAHAEAVSRSRLLDQALRASSNATTLARRQYESGTVSLIEVLDAERTQFDTELEQRRARTETQLRWIDIYRTLGLAPAPAGPAMSNEMLQR